MRSVLLRFVRSMKLRLLLTILVPGMILLIAAQFFMLGFYRSRAVSVRTSEVQTQLMTLANHLINYDYLRDPSSEPIGAELAQFSSLYNGRVLVIDDMLRVVKDTYRMSEGKTVVSADVVKCLRNGSSGRSSYYDREEGFIVLYMPVLETAALESGDYSGRAQETEIVKGVLLASVSTASIENTCDYLQRMAMLAVLIAGVLLAAFSIVAAILLVRPVDRLAGSVAEVRDGFSNQKIPGYDYLETERIADGVNGIVDRVRIMDESRQEFVSNVSHELKTPMTSMKILADSLIAENNVPEEMYKEFLTDIAQEIDRENSIIAELLSLTKLNRKNAPMNITQVNINELMEIILKRVRPIAQKRDIELTLESVREVTAGVDEPKLTMALTNLVENAVKYNKEHGTVTVTVDADPRNFIVKIADTGVGIPEESLDKIYERFYRVDKSRSREVGGSGLGLSITKSAVLLHRGTIQAESKEGEGTTFTVTIPLNYVQRTADPGTGKRT